METGLREASASLEDQIRHWRHPDKRRLITIAGDEECDVPELTASFLFRGAQIEQPEFFDGN